MRLDAQSLSKEDTGSLFSRLVAVGCWIWTCLAATLDGKELFTKRDAVESLTIKNFDKTLMANATASVVCIFPLVVAQPSMIPSMTRRCYSTSHTVNRASNFHRPIKNWHCITKYVCLLSVRACGDECDEGCHSIGGCRLFRLFQSRNLSKI